MEQTNRRLIGVIVVLLGVALLLNETGIGHIDIGRIWSMFWPAILILVGVSSILNKNRTFGIIISAIGVALLLSNVFNINVWGLIWPAIIIGFGVKVLVGNTRSNSNPVLHTNAANSDSIDDFLIFWGSEKRIESNNFTGGSVTVMFGGMELDLRNVNLPPQGARLNITCAFAGLDVFVSNNYQVKCNGNAILGGWDNHYLPLNDDSKPTLTITGTVAFGGVEIKG